MRITIYMETLGNRRSMFRVIFGGAVIAEHLTSAQSHILVGEILERLVLGKKPVYQKSGQRMDAGIFSIDAAGVGSPPAPVQRPEGTN
jgi:hypothetical protein